jgi:hypothetical protein
MLSEGEFQLERLVISGIDNEPVLAMNAPCQREEEIALFQKDVPSGDAYLQLLASRVKSAIESRSPLPVVRFADGEYEFYKGTLKCNGLYRQAESTAAIRKAIPAHIDALCYASLQGILAPLVFPGNIRNVPMFRRLFGKKDGNDQALRFLEFLSKNGVRLTVSNYIPFYAVYAYLSSAHFAAAMDGRTVCVVNSDFNADACAAWFEQAGSRPRLVHVPIPDSYVATRWDSMREEVFRAVPENPDLFMVGAGVGALQVCVDAARRFSAPAIDSGHILNMMNDLERKSQGPRLYTYRR